MRASTIGIAMILASVISGIVVTNIKLSGQSNALGLQQIAFIALSFRYSAMAFGIFAPLSLIGFSIIPSPDRPSRNNRLPLIILALLMALVSGVFIRAEFNQMIVNYKVEQGALSANDIDWIYNTRNSDPLWNSRILMEMTQGKRTADWILRIISERSAEDSNILTQLPINPNCPKDVLERLSKHSDIQISKGANEALRQR